MKEGRQHSFTSMFRNFIERTFWVDCSLLLQSYEQGEVRATVTLLFMFRQEWPYVGYMFCHREGFVRVVRGNLNSRDLGNAWE